MSNRIFQICLLTALLFFSCKKDDTKQIEDNIDPRVEKYNQITGAYNVYDSLGNYLYELDIYHTYFQYNEYGFHDTLHFSGFDGQFYFNQRQSDYSGYPDYTLSIGYQESLYDTLNNRWKIIFSYDPAGVYNNKYNNDTIRIIYRKVNINYYIEDLTTYLDTTIRIVAVKQ